jgi:hypothetical protein
MSATPRLAKVLGVAAFAVVWVVGGLALLQNEGLTRTSGEGAGDQFPPGTIRPGPTEDEQLCGDYLAPRMRPEEEGEHAGELRCMAEAFEAGRPAVLVRRDRNSAGFPTRLQVRVLGDGRLELIVDNSRNPLGDYRLQRSVCTGVDPSTRYPTGCEVLETVPQDR